MIITFAGIILCNGPERRKTAALGVSNLQVGGSRRTQGAGAIRAQAARVFARGNRITAISFNAAIEHESVQDAEYFCIRHEATLPDEGELVFNARGSTGTSALVKFKNAALESSTHTYRGVRTYHSYQFKCGGLPTTDDV